MKKIRRSLEEIRSEQMGRNGVIFHDWFMGMTHRSIAAKHGLSAVRIGQIIGKELRWCRHPRHRAILFDYELEEGGEYGR